jgi:hypothetical protein
MAATTMAMITAATMTDPGQPESAPAISASSAERLAALRQPSKKRSKPAHTSKVLSAGAATTALFGMIAVMGWQSGISTAQGAAALPVPTVPTTQSAPTPVLPTVVPLVPTAAPVLIPVAVPVAQPPVQTDAGRTPSNTTTKSSG